MTSNMYLCLICGDATANKNILSNYLINSNDVTFILRILLEVPHFKLSDQHIQLLLETTLEESQSSSPPLSFSDKWLNICDQCLTAVLQAKQIYSEVLAAAQKFRKVQKKIVEILRQSWKLQKDQLPKSLEPFPFKLCRKFANDHNFNDFGCPITIQNVISSSIQPRIQIDEDEITTSPCSSSSSSTISSSDNSDDSDYLPSSPSVLEPPLKRLRSSSLVGETPNRKSITRRRPEQQRGPIPMTRALFLNIAAITDMQRSTKSFDPLSPPFVMLGKVAPEELPSFISFPQGTDRSSDLLRLINGHKVDFQTKVISSSKDILLDGTKRVWHLNKDNQLPEGRIYYMTDLSKKEEMDVVGPTYQEWKEVGGVLSWLHPGLNCIASVSFIFSQRKSCLGLHMEDLRFSSVNILFQGRKEWDIVHPEDNEDLIQDLKESHKELREEEEGAEGCCHWVLHKNIWIGEEMKQRWRVSTFVQERGEVVMVPPGVLHQVRNLEDCVAASYNFVDGDWVEMAREERREDGEKVFECCCCSHGGRHLLGRGEVERLREAHGQVRVYAAYQAGGQEGQGFNDKYCGKATAQFFDKMGLEDWGKENGMEEEVEHSQGSATTEEFDPTWSEPSEPEENDKNLNGETSEEDSS